MGQTKAFVIAIAAVSGGGKTAVTIQLKKELPHSKAFYFDAYDFSGPESIAEWVERGARYVEWDLTPLLNDIREHLYKGLEFIVLDYPFAYQHSDVGNYIDFVVFIDTPLDIALGRRMIRDYSSSDTKQILSDIEFYMKHGRNGYLNMLERIKPDADVVIDGTLTLEEIVNEIMSYMTKV